MDITDLKIGRDATFIPPLKSNLNTLKAYEKDGYDSLFFADHIMNWIPKSIWTPDITNLASVYESPHLIYEAFTMMSIASLNTRKIKLGTGVTEAFRRHPAVLAQTILTLDQLSNGRTILGIGTGEKENIIPYGIKWDNPVSRLEEAIKIIRLLWENDEKFDYNGKFWNLKNAIFSLKPHKSGRYPPIWLAAHGPRMLDITGRLGDGWLPIYLSPDTYKEKLKIIKTSAQKAGRDFEKFTPALYVNVIVDEDPDESKRMTESIIAKNHMLTLYNEDFQQYGLTHPLGDNIDGVVDYIPPNFERDTILSIINKVPSEMCYDFYINGTPDMVINRIESYAKVGVKHIVLFNYSILCDLKKIPSSNKCMKMILDYFKN